MQNSTIHIKVKPEIAKGLKELSQKRQTSVGELVRQALFSCYQIDLLSLGKKQRRALEAFQGGYISMGKLAEEMGMNISQKTKITFLKLPSGFLGSLLTRTYMDGTINSI